MTRSVVIVPAHNEEKGITKTVESLLQCPSACDIVVIADNCTDSTAVIVQKLGIRVLERNDLKNKGKPYALEFALNILLSEKYAWFIFIDADTIVETNFFDEINKKINENVLALQVRYGLIDSDSSFKQRLGKIAFTAFNYLRPIGRNYWGLSAGILGTGFALSRKTLETVPFNANSLVEDLIYHIQLVKAGITVDYTDHTSVWAKPPPSFSGETAQRTRWEGGRLQAAQEEIPLLLKAIYAGKWKCVEPLFDLLLPPIAYYIFFLILLFLIPIPIVKIYALSVFCLISVYTATALFLMKASWHDWASLAIAPFYILWKLTMIPNLYKALKKQLSWDRSER